MAVGQDEREEWRKRKGAALRVARESRGLSQTELAEKIGVNISTISEIERGVTAPKLATIEAAADALGMPIDALVGRAMPPADVAVETEARSEGDPWSAIAMMQRQIDLLRGQVSALQSAEPGPKPHPKGRRTA